MRVRKVRQSPLDAAHIQAIGMPVPPADRAADFRNVIVHKPWGYEYMMFQTPELELWTLFLRAGAATSMHCHPRKATSLIVVGGQAQLSTLHETYDLEQFDCVSIGAGVFHQTRAGASGARLIETETPADKYDILRLKDEYGRENKPYEGSEMLSVSSHECVRLFDYAAIGTRTFSLHEACTLTVHSAGPVYREGDYELLRRHDLVTLLAGSVRQGSAAKLTVGEVLPLQEFLLDAGSHSLERPSFVLLGRVA